jgi:hypothetical protein
MDYERANLDVGADIGVPMSILSKSNRRVLGTSNVLAPTPARPADIDTTWQGLVHAVTEDKNAEQLTCHLSVQQFNPGGIPLATNQINGLTARVQWGVDGAFHEAFLDIGTGTSFTVQASSIKVSVQNAALNRITGTLLPVTPRKVGASIAVGTNAPGYVGGPRKSFYWLAAPSATDHLVEIPPFADSCVFVFNPFSNGILRFWADNGTTELYRYILSVAGPGTSSQIYQISGAARWASFNITAAVPAWAIAIFNLKI